MRTITTKVYKYAELPENAKETARENYLSAGPDIAWTSENADSLKAFEKIFPVKVRDWEYGGRGKNIRWEFTGDDDHENLSGQRLAAYIWNNYKTDLFKGKYYSAGAPSWTSRHSNIILESSCPFTGYCMDDELTDALLKFMNRPDARTWKELLGECLENWLDACEKDYEAQQSAEYVGEHLEANEYEFTKDGKLV